VLSKKKDAIAIYDNEYLVKWDFRKHKESENAAYKEA